MTTGEVEASSETVAAKLIRGRDLVIINLQPKREIPLNFIKKFQDRIGTDEVVNFTRQLSTMINAGLPLTESLLILRSQSEGAMQNVVSQLLSDVEEGEALSEAMKRNPKVFDTTYVALIKSGEVGGVMDEVLARLSESLEKQQEFRGKVKGAMIYPVIIFFGMLAVSFIMLVFVIPRLTTLYDQFDAELPITTKILISVSDFAAAFWPFIIAAFAVLFWMFKSYKSTKSGQKKFDEIIFKLPLVGDLQRQVILAETSRTLSLMVGSGVSILEALNISADVVKNTVIADALKDTAALVEKGFPVAFAFSKHPDAFPALLSQMISVGEETGKMDEVLEKVSHVFEVESDQKLKSLTAAIEPIILIVMGVGVAFLVVSIVLPIYNLTTQL